jgi:tRNA nucleotidyltransferase (CCA-adding enzyme)
MTRPEAANIRARFEALPGAPRLGEALAGGSEAYLVGGAVRDLLRGEVPFDLDVVLAGDRDLAGTVRRLGGTLIEDRIHDRFGTATLASAPGRAGGAGGSGRIDLALARAERYTQPGTLPVVAPAGIEEDLRRRDFTVNAIALGISGPRRGELIAVEHALDDLCAGQLRVLHEASFLDDPTRLLRLVRYASRLGFFVEPHTERLAREAVAAGALDTVSGPRIGTELAHLSAEPDPVAAYELMAMLRLDAAIGPGFGISDPEVARRAAALLQSDAPPGRSPADAALATALLTVPEPARRPLLDRLGVDAGTRRGVLAAARDATALAATVPPDGPPSQLLAMVPADAPVTIALAAALADPPVAQRLGRWQREWSRIELEMDGTDLISAGVPSGPLVGAALRAALGARLDGRAPTRDDQLAVALGVARGTRDSGH